MLMQPIDQLLFQWATIACSHASYLTQHTAQPFCKATSFSASQEISHFAMNMDVLTVFMKPCSWSPTSATIKISNNTCKIHVLIILPSISGSPNWSLPFSFTDLNTSLLNPPMHAMSPSQLILFDFVTLTLFGERCIILCHSVHYQP